MPGKYGGKPIFHAINENFGRLVAINKKSGEHKVQNSGVQNVVVMHSIIVENILVLIKSRPDKLTIIPQEQLKKKT